MEELVKHFQHLIFEKEIGKGAFATVYKCRKNFSQKKYAAKVVKVEDIKTKWETENEIEILKSLKQHRHVVRLNGVLREDVYVVCLLDYIPGFKPGKYNATKYSVERISNKIYCAKIN